MLGRRWINELGAGRLMENLEGCLEVALLLLLHCHKGRRSLLLVIGEPVTLLETILCHPNGSEDSILEEFFLEGKAPLGLHNEVNTNADFKWGLGEYYKK